jgi:hypothetical protein
MVVVVAQVQMQQAEQVAQRVATEQMEQVEAAAQAVARVQAAV